VGHFVQRTTVGNTARECLGQTVGTVLLCQLGNFVSGFVIMLWVVCSLFEARVTHSMILMPPMEFPN
jgi:uncharacterized membrane protein YdcZ (DUF606 family)